MSDEIEYWRTKYALLEDQFLQQKKRNEELEDTLLRIIEKVETEKKQLAYEIELLTRKLEGVTSRNMNSVKNRNIADETDEPEDPSMTKDSASSSMLCLRSSTKGIVLANRNRSSARQEKGYHHFPVLALEEGIIYGFRWQKGSVVKMV